MAQKNKKEYEFQSEVKQLLNILVYSLYKNKEVFVRELISNAVDALNKVQFELMTDSETEDPGQDLRIDISFNQNQNQLIIEDTGIGMTRKELRENIGTIAHSGTIGFLKKLSKSKDKERLDLIGKFGVGFYSTFMAAEEVHIYTKSHQKGSLAYLWKSTGDSNYTIEQTVKKKRGTRIEVFLKDDQKEFLEKQRIKTILSKYSKFVPFPVYIENEKFQAAEAIWSQPKTSLKKEDYVEFYKFFTNLQEEPEMHLHLSSDAPVQFNAVLFVPKSSMEKTGFFRSPPGVDLYSKKVLIQKSSHDVMPEYLRFVKGVIDSEEIPLNISRETVQNDIKINRIKKHIIKKLISEIVKIKNKNWDPYLRIWDHFNRNFKEGVVSDFENRERLSQLLLFHSSKSREDYTDLDSYLERMPEQQKEIFYTSGPDTEAIEKNPALEAFHKKDLEVLYLYDPLDEFVFEHLGEYKGIKFKLAESAKIEVEEDKEKKKSKAYLEDIKRFVQYLKELYGDKVADVQISKRLVDSPCMLVHPSDGPSIQMERIMKMTNKDYEFSKKAFEINPDHDLIKQMVRIHKKNPKSKSLKQLAIQMLDNMRLREGLVEDVDSIVSQIQEIMLQAAKQARTSVGKKTSEKK
ncbi:MAG: molecular chaperone HtpG [Candidatus Aminicenantes bacterium]|nr:molecular chaperone HtpG [Candidatus Aminicenantes bacterium]